MHILWISDPKISKDVFDLNVSRDKKFIPWRQNWKQKMNKLIQLMWAIFRFDRDTSSQLYIGWTLRFHEAYLHFEIALYPCDHGNS